MDGSIAPMHGRGCSHGWEGVLPSMGALCSHAWERCSHGHGSRDPMSLERALPWHGSRSKTWEKRSHGEQIWEHFWTRSHAWEGGLP